MFIDKIELKGVRSMAEIELQKSLDHLDQGLSL